MSRSNNLVEYQGDNSILVYKHPEEIFDTKTTLLVHQAQEAIFFRNGIPLDAFGPGIYALEADNLPLMQRVINLVKGKDTSFQCEIYFIHKSEQMAIKWGTDSKVEYMEPTYQFPIQIGACGEMSISIMDARKMLVKLVGMGKELDKFTVAKYFKAAIMTRVKSYLARTMREQKINIFEVDEQLDVLSDALKARINNDFVEYGIKLEQFLVTTIAKPEEDPMYEKYRSLHFRQYADVAEAQLQQRVELIQQQTLAQKRVIEAQSLAQKRSLEGFTYQQERGFDIAMEMAKNGCELEFDSFQTMIIPTNEQGIANVVSNTEGLFGFCMECGERLPKAAKFCSTCGTKQ